MLAADFAGARRAGSCSRALDAIEALPQRGVFLFQGFETRNDGVLSACCCHCGNPLNGEDCDSTANHTA